MSKNQDNLNEMRIAFPGQEVVLVPMSVNDAAHVCVPYTPENESLLKRRGYFYEREGNIIRVYFPSESYLNN